MHKVVIHTDGACRGNPGPGGWAAILQHAERQKELKGAERDTTNNRMEILAAIEGLRALKGACIVEVWTDSQYLKKGFTEWMPCWKANQWQRKEGKQLKPVKNVDLWQQLDRMAAIHKVTFHWLRGHNGHPLNERCDQLAEQAIDDLLAMQG
ncbi:MAG TPA: ribonuclease HI [Planctomycetota bacterium]|nr:ribonuclease HI [Planctomycetota bacterium]